MKPDFYIPIESAAEAIVIVDDQGQIAAINTRFEQLFGYPGAELIGRPVEMLVPDSNRSQHHIYRAEYQKQPTPRSMGGAVGESLRGRHRDGHEIDIEIGLNPLTINGTSYVAACIIDITARKLAEAVLRKTEHQYTALFNAMPEGFCIIEVLFDAHNRAIDYLFLEVNKSFEAQTGMHNAKGKRMREFAPDHEEYWFESFGRVVLTGESIHFINEAKELKRWYEVTAVRLGEPGSRQLAILFCDITDRKRSEELLLQSNKMESIGRLAGGIAHDFNNLLSVILSTIQLMQIDKNIDASLLDDLSIIRQSAERAAGLTKQMLQFARKQAVLPESLNLSTLINNMENMLRRLIGENIELIILMNETPWNVLVDAGQIEQVIINLSVNARDAMPDGGKLTLEVHNVVLDDYYIRAHPEMSPGEYVMLTVSDTGSGMDEHIKAHIFEPFYTTKAVGRGTGLGLATCHGIIRQAGGFIWLYSEPGHGAIFKIYLPRHQLPAKPTRADEHVLSQGTETLLLVEDEASLLAVSERMLRKLGYQVLTATNGEEALRIVTAYREPVHLVLTDIVMPKMGGKELAEKLGKLRPDIPVMFMSGYTDNVVVHHNVIDDNVVFLQKPFTMDLLAKKVREAINKHTNS